MIKIIQAEYLQDKKIKIIFSDGCWGEYNLQPLADMKTVLTQVLDEDISFKQFYLEMGALCWRNGLELSPSNIWFKLERQHLLHKPNKAA